MDFLRNSFPTWDVADGLFPDRNFGSIDASISFRPVPFLGLNAMSIRTDIPHDSTSDTLQDDAQLHAALRDVPLPVGFMRRMRQLVGQGLESSE